MVTVPTCRQLVKTTTSRLASATEAQWVVEHALAVDGSSKGRLAHGSLTVLGQDEPVSPSVVSLVESLVERRQAGEPLQYVLGTWPFRTLELAVDHRVLIPRPETEQVVEVALAELRRVMAQRGGPGTAVWPPRTVDLGTGSGAIALSLAVEGGSRHADLEVWATDSSTDALDVARSNLEVLLDSDPDDVRARHGAARLDAAHVHLLHGSWFAALPAYLAGSIVLIVSNPPYVSAEEYPDLDPVVHDWEPEGALVAGPGSDGSAGLADVETIIAGAPRWLVDGGAVVIELAPHQAEVAAAMARRGGFVDVRVEPDLAGRPRALVASKQ